MIIRESENYKRQFEDLPEFIKKKCLKKLMLLKENFFYPSLHTKKKKGEEDRWEARIDYHYRISFRKSGEVLFLQSVGPHDEGLGKK